jgi:hypothetical protein
MKASDSKSKAKIIPPSQADATSPITYYKKNSFVIDVSFCGREIE